MVRLSSILSVTKIRRCEWFPNCQYCRLVIFLLYFTVIPCMDKRHNKPVCISRCNSMKFPEFLHHILLKKLSVQTHPWPFDESPNWVPRRRYLYYAILEFHTLMQSASSGRSRIFLRAGGANSQSGCANLLFWPKTAWKWKNLDARGEGASLAPLGPKIRHWAQSYTAALDVWNQRNSNLFCH